MTDDLIFELADRAGLGGFAAAYPALMRVSVERGLSRSPALDAAREPTTEPAHIFAGAQPAQ